MKHNVEKIFLLIEMSSIRIIKHTVKKIFLLIGMSSIHIGTQPIINSSQSIKHLPIQNNYPESEILNIYNRYSQLSRKELIDVYFQLNSDELLKIFGFFFIYSFLIFSAILSVIGSMVSIERLCYNINIVRRNRQYNTYQIKKENIYNIINLNLFVCLWGLIIYIYFYYPKTIHKIDLFIYVLNNKWYILLLLTLNIVNFIKIFNLIKLILYLIEEN